MSRNSRNLPTAGLLALAYCALADADAHEPTGHAAATYEISAPAELQNAAPGRRLVELQITGENGENAPARFSLEADGKPFVPESLNAAGIRFTSIHTSKKQRETVLFSRGTGPVRFQIPAETGELRIHVTKGYEFLPLTRKISTPASDPVEITLTPQRWIDLAADDWSSSDPHLHYERTSPKRDADWAAMMAADGLHQGFFMVLKGGNLPGIWAEQFAYGADGARAAGKQLLVPGEEFRGTAQGHNNLLGLGKVIQPISVGGLGAPKHLPNWPAMHDVLRETRETGGIGGPAHGGTFGRASTVYLDALLGASEFVELANTHLYELGPWYDLLNCGVMLAPVAGTDLPNFPFREPWQPFFGEMRTYVKTSEPTKFEDWKRGVRAGKTFVTSGPIVRLRVGGRGLGHEAAQLPAGGGEILVEAEMLGPRPLHKLEIVQNGRVIPVEIDKTREFEGLPVNRWTIRKKLRFEHSGWVAIRGEGEPKRTLWAKSGILKPAIAHTAAVPVLVGGEPIRDAETVATVREKLRQARAWYAEKGVFPDEAARGEMLALFDRALKKL